MRFLNNKKSNNEVVDAVLKEGEKIYREVKNEETGEVTYVEIEIPGKKEETEETKDSEKKPKKLGEKAKKIIGAVGLFTGGLAMGLAAGVKAGTSKVSEGPEVSTDDREPDNNAE